MNPVSHLSGLLRQAATFYSKDVMALSDEAFNSSFAGKARRPVDFTYEVIYVNRRIAAMFRGEEFGASGEGWMVAPEGWNSREQAVEELKASVDEVISEWEKLTDEQRLEKKGEGMFAAPYDRMTMACVHMFHHGGQLNYVQSLHGDDEMHWG